MEYLFPHDLSVVFVQKLHERRDERETKTADEYVEYTGDVTERQRALRRTLPTRYIHTGTVLRSFTNVTSLSFV